MMKPRIYIAVLLAVVLCAASSTWAQVGTWEITIKRKGSPKETGTAWFTLNPDGTSTGYALTTLTFDVATYAGTWSLQNGAVVGSVTETLGSQQFQLSLYGKVSTRSYKS